MKGIILAIVIVFMAGMAFAEPIDLGLTKIELPEAKGGIVFLPEEEKLEATAMATVLKYTIPEIQGIKPSKLNLDVIYGVQNLLGAGIAYEVGSLANIPGVELPIAKYLDCTVGIGCLYDFNNEEYEFAIYATAVKVKF